MELPDALFISAVILLFLVITITGLITVCYKFKNRSLPNEAIVDLEKKLEEMSETLDLNYNEFSLCMEEITDRMTETAKKIMPKTLHITHTSTSIDRKEHAEMETQTDQIIPPPPDEEKKELVAPVTDQKVEEVTSPVLDKEGKEQIKPATDHKGEVVTTSVLDEEGKEQIKPDTGDVIITILEE